MNTIEQGGESKIMTTFASESDYLKVISVYAGMTFNSFRS
jgi:hypothetical protein